MATSKKSTGDESYNLTSFAADIHASLSAKQENDEAKTTQDTFGRGYEKPLANYDPDTQCWKMYGDISLWGEPQSLASLPPSGMTQNGVLYQQPAWAQITDEIELSLWPTPTAHPNNSNKNGKFKNPTLRDAVNMWPTPTTQEVEHPEAVWNEKGRRVSPNGNTHSMGLADAVQKWPTPTAAHAYTHALKSSQQTPGSRHSLNLPSAAGKQLNPTWVEWLMGFPTGWTDLEA
jgi:hypothetical protein